LSLYSLLSVLCLFSILFSVCCTLS
jgi:hypothetical protein